MKALRGLVWLCVPATVWCAEDIAVNTFLARTGNWFRVTVTVQMPPDWHINANPAAEQGLIPTTVSWKPSAGVRIRSVKYPPGKHYEGRVEIVTEGEAPVGPLRLEGALRYQACYKDTCYPPKTVPLLVTSEDAVPPPPGSAGWLSQGAMTADVTPILPQAPAAAMPLWVMLLGAFVGGMLLNLMPCVLPVISLKILGFVQEGASRRLGLIYGLGVLVSFWLLAAAIIGLKLAGRQVGWGFQFQDVRFVLAMSLLCTTIALSLFGVFEFGLGGRTLEGVMKLATRKGHAGAFFNGMLAVLLATPCTAPFLAPALGFAFTQSPPVIFLALTAVALGLAVPYVLLAWNARWLKWLPKPGVWLNAFKQFMGFPMLATALWLAWVAGAPRGASALISVIAWLLVSSFLVWLAATLRPGRLRWIALALAAAVALGWWQLAPGKPLIDWQPFSKAALEEALKTRQPVFVNFTADWCLTCQVNKRVALETKAVAERFRSLGVIALLADWTQPNAEIEEALRGIGRSGVPAYVFYPADRAKPPVVLPEVLTQQIVLNAVK